MTKFGFTVGMLAFAIGSVAPAAAQTIGYAEAIGSFAVACGKDLNSYCKKENLGGGRVLQCLGQRSSPCFR